jgi:heme-degrading monooxygenase HmoA
MAFVRTVSYTFPYERINDLVPGTDLQMRLVPAHKLICQESNGMIDTGVWVTQDRDGTMRVVSYTEWSSVNDLQTFANDADVKHHEEIITRATKDGQKTVDIYEVMG